MSIEYDYIFRRQHPNFRKNRDVWKRSKDAFSGGVNYIHQALVKHVAEIDVEYQERVHRACYFNYPRKIAQLITQYILSVEPSRENYDSKLVEDFSRDGLRANEVMRQFSTLLNVFGSAALIVEMPSFEGVVDEKRKQDERLRPAVRALSPLQIIDWAIGSDGKLEWILIEEVDRLDGGPFLPGVDAVRRKLWTRDEFYVFEKDSVTGLTATLARGSHDLGEVPVIHLVEPENAALNANHYFEDVVRISDAILNNESEAQMNIVKQLFGLLVISDSFARGARSEQSGTSGDNNIRFSHVLARSAAIWESPEERGISRYISPSGINSETIRSENQMLKKELFEIVGLGLQPESNKPQTAESKAWDNHLVRQFLASRVDMLEQAEMRVWQIMNSYDKSIKIPTIYYNRDFSIVDLASSISSLLELKQVSGGLEYRREIARTALFLLEKVKKITPERKQTILDEIENWQTKNGEES